MELREAFTAAVNLQELREPRRIVCRTLAAELAACGERLWAFGFGPADFRTALSLVVQFGGSLATGAVALGEGANLYAAEALVRQLIEVQYLVRLFRRAPEEAVTWLKAAPAALRKTFSPREMRKRLGAGEFRYQEYRVHCEIGGHPALSAHHLLPGRSPEVGRPQLDSNQVFWIDLAQHLRCVWRDLAVIPEEHPSANLDVILQYTEAATIALKAWEELDPCSPMLPESILAELTTSPESPA